MRPEHLRDIRRDAIAIAIGAIVAAIVLSILISRLEGGSPPGVVVPIPTTPAPMPAPKAEISDPVRPPLEEADGGSRAD